MNSTSQSPSNRPVPNGIRLSLGSILLTVFCLVLAGCTEKLDLNNLPTLPSHWRNVSEQGNDTRVGHFASTEKSLVIVYDIGPLAGSYANPKAGPLTTSVRSAQLGDSSFYYRVSDNGKLLYITYPNEGPANFSTAVNGQNDIDYVLELVARHRHELLHQPPAAK
jgi:hypothetical protein